MKARFEKLLARYGQSITVTDRRTGEAAAGKAFVQPVLKRREEVPVAVTALGGVSEERWLYLGSAGMALSPGDTVETGGMAFAVQEVRTVWWKDDALYRWAMLRRKKEAAV